MPWIIGAAALGGALISSNSAKSAANTQAGAADRAAEAQLQAARESNQLQREIFDKQSALQREVFDRQVSLQEPFRQAGMAGQNRLMELLGLGGNTGAQGYGSAMRDFGMADFQADPGYQFRQDQGMQAIDRLYGGRLSGRAMKDAMRFNQGLADQSYQDAFNRFQTNRANKLNPLQSLGGLAQSSSNAIGSAAGAYGSNVGNAAGAYGTNVGNALMNATTGAQNALMGGANARASSYLNQGTNWANTVNQLGALGARGFGQPGGFSGMQAAFSQTPMGASGFGTGLAYNNQDLGGFL